MSAGLAPVVMRSADGVEMELPVAGPTPRMLAYAIDLVLVYLMLAGTVMLALLLVPLAEWLAAQMPDILPDLKAGRADRALTALAPLIVLVQFLVTFHEFLYFGIWELVTRGRSPGKYLVGLRVVTGDGRPAMATQTLIRNALRLVDSLPAVYTVGLVSMVMSPRGQRLGDRAADTCVVRTGGLPVADEVALPAAVQPLALSRQQLAAFGEREVALVRSTLRRLPHMHPGQRDELLEQVAGALEQRLQLEREPMRDPLSVLQRLLATANTRR